MGRKYRMNIQDLLKFWDFIHHVGMYVEIRLVSISNPEVYGEANNFCKNPENSNIICKNNCQFFLDSCDDLIRLLQYKDEYFSHNSKICYALSPKQFVNCEISGGYKNSPLVTKFYLDIEKVEHGNLTESERKQLRETYIKGSIIPSLKRFGLRSYVLIDSVGGFHLIYNLKPTKITEGRKLWFKEFMNDLVNKMRTKEFKIDCLKDFTRVTALPETRNNKRDGVVKIIEFNDEINDKFIIKSRRPRKIGLPKSTKFITAKLQNCRAVHVFRNNPPKGEIHNTLLFAIRLAMKATNFENWEKLGDELNDIRGTNHNFDPEYGTEGKEYNSGIMYNWCRRNEDWCNKNFKDWKSDQWW